MGRIYTYSFDNTIGWYAWNTSVLVTYTAFWTEITSILWLDPVICSRPNFIQTATIITIVEIIWFADAYSYADISKLQRPVSMATCTTSISSTYRTVCWAAMPTWNLHLHETLSAGTDVILKAVSPKVASQTLQTANSPIVVAIAIWWTYRYAGIRLTQNDRKQCQYHANNN
jgi:hypothetical protein